MLVSDPLLPNCLFISTGNLQMFDFDKIGLYQMLVFQICMLGWIIYQDHLIENVL